MNKHEFFLNELTEMVNDRNDMELVTHYIWISECAKFRDAVDFGEIIDKDAETYPIIKQSMPVDFDDFDTNDAIKIEKYSTKALCRKHRKSRRMAKVNHRKNSRWIAYLDGTAKECKTKNHRAVRREYDMPIGKGNFYRKVGCYEYFW